jgi:CheY-like chemotaxis protein
MNRHSILMLEYDEDDRYITHQYFQKINAPVTLQIVNSSEEILGYLKECKLKKKELPSLLLLNYNSTPLNAPELLRELKNDKEWQHIPVVVLSGILTPSIVKDCYSMGASSFIQKPTLMEETNKKIGSFIDYWFRTVELT